MGLFSSVLHLRDIERDSLIATLGTILQDAGFVRERLGAVPARGPYMLQEFDGAAAAGPCYVASPFSGRWVTLIQTSFDLPTVPHLSDLSRRLSSVLSCYALALIVHDDDLFFYNLDYKGMRSTDTTAAPSISRTSASQRPISNGSAIRQSPSQRSSRRAAPLMSLVLS